MPTTVSCGACAVAFYAWGRPVRLHQRVPPTYPIEPPKCPGCGSFLSVGEVPPPIGACKRCELEYYLDALRVVTGCACGGRMRFAKTMPIEARCESCQAPLPAEERPHETKEPFWRRWLRKLR